MKKIPRIDISASARARAFNHRDYGFVFSSDINDWRTNSKKKFQEKRRNETRQNAKG